MSSHYPRPEILAETGWLAEHLGDPSVRIVDCDEFAAYQRLHVPGAVGLKVHHYLKAEGERAPGQTAGTYVMGPEEFERVMSEHGIGSQHTVVAYDGMGGLYAARLWWALDYYGHTNCKLLNGGFHKWFSEGRPVTRDQPHVEPATFRVRPGSDCLCTLDGVRDALGREAVVIWDVRSREEHTGDDRRQNRRAGRIPGAVHLEWLDMTVRPPERSGLLLPAGEIRCKLDILGITPEKQVLTH
ncbi:MAG: sulfurtransferase [Chloroflexi bacterium]|nr:sulfurtransferase [Chloroflexota bacterium]